MQSAASPKFQPAETDLAAVFHVQPTRFMIDDIEIRHLYLSSVMLPITRVMTAKTLGGLSKVS